MTKILTSTSELMEKCKADKEHALQVKEYCEKIFNALNQANLTNFSEREKDYLTTAALLHDIGYVVEKKSHHKHTMEIVIENGLKGFDETETKIIANIARYHRGSNPDKNKHERYASLTKEERQLVKKLSSILRIADGMDKPHKNLILRIEVKESEESFDFYIKTVGFKPKLKMAEEKSSLFEKVFKKPVKFLFV